MWPWNFFISVALNWISCTFDECMTCKRVRKASSHSMSPLLCHLHRRHIRWLNLICSLHLWSFSFALSYISKAWCCKLATLCHGNRCCFLRGNWTIGYKSIVGGSKHWMEGCFQASFSVMYESTLRQWPVHFLRSFTNWMTSAALINTEKMKTMITLRKQKVMDCLVKCSQKHSPLEIWKTVMMLQRPFVKHSAWLQQLLDCYAFPLGWPRRAGHRPIRMSVAQSLTPISPHAQVDAGCPWTIQVCVNAIPQSSRDWMFKKMKPKITMCNTHRSFKITKSYISDSLEVSVVNADVHDGTLGQCAVDRRDQSGEVRP